MQDWALERGQAVPSSMGLGQRAAALTGWGWWPICRPCMPALPIGACVLPALNKAFLPRRGSMHAETEGIRHQAVENLLATCGQKPGTVARTVATPVTVGRWTVSDADAEPAHQRGKTRAAASHGLQVTEATLGSPCTRRGLCGLLAGLPGDSGGGRRSIGGDAPHDRSGWSKEAAHASPVWHRRLSGRNYHACSPLKTFTHPGLDQEPAPSPHRGRTKASSRSPASGRLHR